MSDKHKEALEALDTLQQKFMNTDLNTCDLFQLSRPIREALQAASWQDNDDDELEKILFKQWMKSDNPYNQGNPSILDILRFFIKALKAAPVDGGE